MILHIAAWCFMFVNFQLIIKLKIFAVSVSKLIYVTMFISWIEIVAGNYNYIPGRFSTVSTGCWMSVGV